MKEDSQKSQENRSKYLSYLLRHHPEKVSCTIDKYGWVDVSTLIVHSDFDMAELSQIVSADTRYEFSADKTKIRAFHGHSVKGVQYPEIAEDIAVLYHGTSERNLAEILKSESILPMSRAQVHLSASVDDAIRIGARHGKPVVLEIDADEMQKDGYKFYKSKDNVYLVSEIPLKYVKSSLMNKSQENKCICEELNEFESLE